MFLKRTIPRDPVTGKIEAGVALLPAAAGVVLFEMVCGELTSFVDGEIDCG